MTCDEALAQIPPTMRTTIAAAIGRGTNRDALLALAAQLEGFASGADFPPGSGMPTPPLMREAFAMLATCARDRARSLLVVGRGAVRRWR